MNNNLVDYYHQRAAEYEKIYSKPERQEDLSIASGILQEIFAGKTVFEMACGTGFWTERIAQTATSVMATDVNQAVIDIAREKYYPHQNVNFDVVDIFQMETTQQYDAVFGGFIWSHILLQDLDRFVDIAKNLVVPGGLVVFMDNRYVEGSNLPVTRTDESGNTFQTRLLEDSTVYEVLKNFPSEEFLRDQMAGAVSALRYWGMEYYWIVSGMNSFR